MNCQDIKDLSSDYLDQRMAPSEIILFEEHLKACSGCRQEVEALRKTISLLGSLDEIETSPDFLSQVHRKIDRGGNTARLWAWFFEPIKIKVPLEITALLFLSFMAFQLYKSPELSRESKIPSPLESPQRPQDKPQEKALERGGRDQESYRVVEPKAPAILEGQLSQSMPSDAPNKVSEEVAASAPRSEIQEVVAEDVARYEGRVKVLLAEVGGRLLVQEGSLGSGLLLTVELPQSRQAEFLSALREEAGAKSKLSGLKRGRVGEIKEEAREKDALGATGQSAERKVAPELESSLRMDEAMVRLHLRILPKK